MNRAENTGIEKTLEVLMEYYRVRKHSRKTMDCQRAGVVVFINYLRNREGVRTVQDLTGLTPAVWVSFAEALNNGCVLRRGTVSPRTVRSYLGTARHYVKVVAGEYGLECPCLIKEEGPDAAERDMRKYPAAQPGLISYTYSKIS